MIFHQTNNSPVSGFELAGLAEGNDGRLYAATIRAGRPNEGTIFSLNKDRTAMTVLHTFAPSQDEAWSINAASFP